MSREQRWSEKQSSGTKNRGCSTTRTIVRVNGRFVYTCIHSSTSWTSSLQHDEEDEEEDTVEGVAVSKGETVRDLQNQKTHVQSSEALAYLARFLFSFASLRRFNISWYNVSNPSWRPSPVIAQAGCTLMHALPGIPASSRTPKCFSNSPTSLAPVDIRRNGLVSYWVYWEQRAVTGWGVLFKRGFPSLVAQDREK